MTILCDNEECGAPETQCVLGLKRGSCPSYQAGVASMGNDVPAAMAGDAESERLPWSGDALSQATLPLVSGLRRPHILALVGLPDAGKTSFLTTVYHRLRRERLGGRDFAGSMTLRGWEVLHQHIKWRPDMPPSYPPRTSGAQREPGFLHLALRGDDDQLVDLLLNDTPGEWFRTFVDDEDVPGAQVTLDLADGILFALDPTSLMGSRRHGAKRRLIGLVRRIHEHAPAKPFSLVLTRADQSGPPEDSAELLEVLDVTAALYPERAVHHTVAAFETGRAANSGQGVLEAVAEMQGRLEVAQTVRPAPLPRESLLARLYRKHV